MYNVEPFIKFGSTWYINNPRKVVFKLYDRHRAGSVQEATRESIQILKFLYLFQKVSTKRKKRAEKYSTGKAREWALREGSAFLGITVHQKPCYPVCRKAKKRKSVTNRLTEKNWNRQNTTMSKITGAICPRTGSGERLRRAKRKKFQDINDIIVYCFRRERQNPAFLRIVSFFGYAPRKKGKGETVANWNFSRKLKLHRDVYVHARRERHLSRKQQIATRKTSKKL